MNIRKFRDHLSKVLCLPRNVISLGSYNENWILTRVSVSIWWMYIGSISDIIHLVTSSRSSSYLFCLCLHSSCCLTCLSACLYSLSMKVIYLFLQFLYHCTGSVMLQIYFGLIKIDPVRLTSRFSSHCIITFCVAV